MRRRQRGRGQALVEFALALPIFLMLMMAVFDLGRAIYMYNGVSQAAREIARVTSVYRGDPLGSSSQTATVLATQQGLIPNLGTPTFTCVDIDGSSITTKCKAGEQVKVVIFAPYSPVTPGLSLVGTLALQASSTVSIQ